MRTIVIWDSYGMAPIQFAVLEGDYSHLNGVYINSDDATNEQCDELSAITKNVTMLDSFPMFPLEPDDKVIVAGFLP